MHVFPGVWFSSSYVSPVLLDLLFSRMYITPVCMVLKDVRFYRMHTFQNVWFSRSYGFPAELLVGSSPSVTQLLDKPLKIVPLRKPKLESNHLPHAITHSILLVSAAPTAVNITPHPKVFCSYFRCVRDKVLKVSDIDLCSKSHLYVF